MQKGLNNGEEYYNSTIPYQLIPKLREHNPEIAKSARIRSGLGLTFTYDKKDIAENDCAYVEPEMFDIVNATVEYLDQKSFFKEENQVAISRSLANKIFKDSNPLGQLIQVNHNTEYKITAIFADIPNQSTIRFNAVIPFIALGERINHWSWESSGYIQLNPNTNVEEFEEKIFDTIKKHSPGTKNDVLIRPLSKVRLWYSDGSMGSIKTLIIYAIIGVMLMLIACMNYMNLSTAYAVLRQKEIGVRKTVGATKTQLMSQFLFESALLTFSSFVASIILLAYLYPFAKSYLSADFVINFAEPALWGIIGLLFLVVSFVSGSYPALVLSAIKPYAMLKAKSKSPASVNFRNILVVIQFSISVALIITTFALIMQSKYLVKKDLGYNNSSIIKFRIAGEMVEKFDAFKAEALNIPGVIDIVRSDNDISYVGNVNPVHWEGKPNDDHIMFNFWLTEPGSIDFYGMELVEGNRFTETENPNTNVEYIVNEKAIEIMELDDPIGKSFTMYDTKGTIVGVVKNFHFQSLDQELGPLMISSLRWYRRVIMIKFDEKAIETALPKLEKLYNSMVSDFPFEFQFLDQSIQRHYYRFMRLNTVITYFAVIAIFISCLGLFGLSGFTVMQKTKEIGIRKVLGSTRRNIVYILSKSFFKLIIVANIIAFPVSWFLSERFLNLFEYRISLTPIVFIGGLAMSLIIAFATISWHTFRAASANPVDSLKYE
jgi:putative ABC transport system permease protein